jgi:hypothetical protein
MKSYIKEFIAMAAGETTEVQAIRAQRTSKAALKTHICIKEGNAVKLEEEVELAKENLMKARLNFGQPVTDGDDYVATLIAAKNRVTEAEEALEENTLLIAFLKENEALLD